MFVPGVFSGRRIPGGVCFFAEGVSCPGCGDVVFPARVLSPGDVPALVWLRGVDSLSVIGERERSTIWSYEEVARNEDAMERAFIRREEIENAKRFALMEVTNKEEGI